MSWRESLWAAAEIASTFKEQAQSTLTSAAAQVQQTYNERTNHAAAAYSAVTQHDGTSHGASGTAPDSSSNDSSLTSIAASFPSLTSLSSSLPQSFTSLTLPSALSSRLAALTDTPSPNNTAPAPVDADDEQSEQLISAASHTQRDRQPDSDVAILTFDPDEVELPSLVVNKTSLSTPIKPASRINDSDDAPSLYYTPQQHRAKQQRATNGNGNNHSHAASAASPEQDAHFNSAQQSTTQLFRAQDDVLDSMRGSIARLGEMSHDIGGELGEQEAMLSEVSGDMGESQGLMDTSRKKIQKLLDGAPRYHLYIIGLMCLIVVVLLYFILYT